jgi:diguanylate cyclase (GGDEF)-like protein
MVVSWAGVRAWKLPTFVFGCVVAVVGVTASPRPHLWPQLVLTFAIAILAQAAAVRFRHAHRVVYLGWGEAALIVVVFLLPIGWVPVTMGAGAAIGQCLYRLRTGIPFSWRIAVNAGQLTIAALAGAFVAHAVADEGLLTVTPETVVASVVGACTYSLVAVSLVNVWFATSVADLVRSDARMLLGKAPMVIGSMALGIVFVAVFQRHRDFLLVMPVVLVIMQQIYLYRSRSVDERRIWRDFAEVARSLNQLDERLVVIAAADGVQRLFAAAAVEVWVEHLTSGPGGYRSTPTASGASSTVELAGHPVDYPVAPSATRTLTINGLRIGELRVWMAPGSQLELREHMAMSVVGEAIAAALHDASAHRTLRVLAARSFHDAHHDALTGLPNRATLALAGDERLAALAEGASVAMLVLGVDRFKEVNDTLGHRAGDELLRLIGARLSGFAAPGDLVARLIGDRFALLMTALDARDREDSASASAQKLAELLSAPAGIGGMQLAVEVSVGVAVALASAYDVDELLRQADIAMHRAKRGTSAYAIYGADDADESALNPDRLTVVLDLREAIQRSDQLVLDVLPTLDLDTGEPRGGEALIRWHHPRRGLLAPSEFVDIVDTSDLAAPFTRYVLDRALALASGWAAEGVPLPVSVNLSPRSLADPRLPDDIEAMLTRYALPAPMLILDITENAVVAGQAVADEVLARLRRLGVQIAVDDFGTGVSSLTFLARVPIDEVKVDASFVRAMVESPQAAAIVRTTVDLGRRLGVRVVAEGIESAAQRTALRDLGCPAGQGRHLVAPISADLTGTTFRRLAATAVPDRSFPPL